MQLHLVALALLVASLSAIRHPDYDLPKPRLSEQAPVNVDVPELLIEQSVEICQDATFYMNPSKIDLFSASKKAAACPPGYKLADLNTPELFNYGAIFVFGCIGPSKDAWIGKAMGTVWAEGRPVKLTSPDAIEKGGIFIKANKKSRRKSRATKQIFSDQNLGMAQPIPRRVNVRAYGKVDLDETDIRLPFLCQVIAPQQSEEKAIE